MSSSFVNIFASPSAKTHYSVTARENRIPEVLSMLGDVGVFSTKVKKGIRTTWDGFDTSRYEIEFDRAQTDSEYKERQFLAVYQHLLLKSISEGSHP